MMWGMMGNDQGMERMARGDDKGGWKTMGMWEWLWGMPRVLVDKGRKCISLVWQGVLGDEKGIGKLNVKGCMEFVFGVIRGAKEQQRFQNEYQGTS